MIYYVLIVCVILETATCFPWKHDMIPLQAPGNFTLVEFVDDQAKIVWDPVPEDTVRGNFQGYVVRIWNHAKSTEYALPNHVASLMVDFFPYSKNFITVSVRNNKFVGPISEVISFDAPQTAPHTPLRFEARQLGGQSVLLNWTRPEANGILLGYRIICQEVLDDWKLRDEMTATNQVNDPDEYTAKLTGLQPGRRYRITIFAANCVGESLGKDLDFRMTAHDSSTPSIPDLQVKVNFTEPHVLGECAPERERPVGGSWLTHYSQEGSPSPSSPATPTTMSNEFDFVEVKAIKEKAYVTTERSCLVDTLVTWLPDMSGNPGGHFYVKYRAKGEDDFHETSPEFQQDHTLIHDYNSCKPHEIILVAVDGDSSTESDPKEVPRYKYGYL